MPGRGLSEASILYALGVLLEYYIRRNYEYIFAFVLIQAGGLRVDIVLYHLGYLTWDTYLHMRCSICKQGASIVDPSLTDDDIHRFRQDLELYPCLSCDPYKLANLHGTCFY